MLRKNDTVVVIVDIQGRLAEIMADRDALFENAKRLIRGARAFGLPLICTEQIPEKLGPTSPEIAQLITETPIPKNTFSCAGEPTFVEALEETRCNSVLLAGIETHICVYQTAIDLKENGYDVHLVTDAVSSRTPQNRALGIDRIARAGVELTSVEMALFELQRVADGDVFRQIIKIVK